ncbi:MAG: hypothetical protein JSS27_13320 [Planctomycetes bacterium]|nr:hypothetical protein [Planctomycetota bacterium]
MNELKLENLTTTDALLEGPGRRPTGPRGGFATIMVLSMLAVVLTVSFIALRSQTTLVSVQGNANLDNLSSQAALAGFSMALRKMSQTDWGGMDSSVSGTLATSQSFVARYATGDPTLTTSSANYSDYPYRVTITSVGTATDPARPTISAKHTVTAVVRLMPRQVPTDPTALTTALNYTVYQTGTSTFELQLPCQISGDLRIQGNVRFCDSYPPSNSGNSQYFSDLNAMRSNGYADMRPLTGTLFVPSNRINSPTATLITSTMGGSISYTSSSSTSNWSYPGTIAAYQLYPGGLYYQVPALSSTLANTTLAPDPKTNPLGLFQRSGTLTISSNVNVTGMIIASGDVNITGQNVTLQAASLPALSGTTTPIQLPVMVSNGNLYVASQASATVRGLIALWSNFDIQQGKSSTKFDFQGRMIVGGVQVEERTDWQLGNTWWNWLWNWYNASNVTYYPIYLSAFGMQPQPILTIQPEQSSVNYQWKDQSNTVYVASSSDPGLRWTVLSWTMN